ncbi:hypothetical protein [Sorangium cellulosum]|uniref:Uncharacterized protein n=1 Tax=Sorangium cellulosum So0157-2 TaxID=1254432 RepID=S4Y3J7_SORCE|nr:hypothetical protein [Sorangium cellulosum]AGP38790.1 hypothetical protein SCE1572_32490 [Sorangium cellulosum So0157-2]
MPKKQNNTHYDRWRDQAKAAAQTENPLKVPYDVALKEAGQVAGFFDKHWNPRDTLPGLRRVKARLPESTGEEIVSLVYAVQEAQTKLLLLVDPVVVDHGERARLVLDEIESALEFLLDDGVEEPADAQLTAIQEFHADIRQRSSALHQALSDYAGLADALKDRLAEVDEDFDVALITEAKELARALAAAPAAPPAADSEVKEATRIRNGLLRLLQEKMALVRKAAARVFQRNPEVLREVTSSYERRRRAAARRAKAARDAAKAESAPAKGPGESPLLG